MVSKEPLISIIVPLYNREKFVQQLLDTFARQTYQNFELILVDDGSTDQSAGRLAPLAAQFSQNVDILYQENAGPYAARNLGLQHAAGDFIAFQDSDDEWPEYHLESLLTFLLDNSDVDFVFGSIRRIQHATGDVILESNFSPEPGSRHPFLQLDTEKRGDFEVVIDPKVRAVSITSGMPGSTQCGLYRRGLFAKTLFDSSYRSVYDRFFGIRLILAGAQVAYTERTHQIYHVHDQHISLVAGAAPEKRESSAKVVIRGYRDLLLKEQLSGHERRVARKALAKVYALNLAPVLGAQGKRVACLRANLVALWNDPFNLRYAKYTVVSCIGVFTNSPTREIK